MGVISFFSSCSCDSYADDNTDFDFRSKRAKKRERQKRNKLAKQVTTPDPSKFEILETFETSIMKDWCIVKVRYEEATNYEGEKILMYNAPLSKVLEQQSLDPHFCDGDHVSPFARFEPTKRGWRFAKYLLHMLFAL